MRGGEERDGVSGRDSPERLQQCEPNDRVSTAKGRLEKQRQSDKEKEREAEKHLLAKCKFCSKKKSIFVSVLASVTGAVCRMHANMETFRAKDKVEMNLLFN